MNEYEWPTSELAGQSLWCFKMAIAFASLIGCHDTMLQGGYIVVLLFIDAGLRISLHATIRIVLVNCDKYPVTLLT